MSSDPSDFEPITPGHIITVSVLRSLPEREVTSNNTSSLEPELRLQQINNNFGRNGLMTVLTNCKLEINGLPLYQISLLAHEKKHQRYSS